MKRGNRSYGIVVGIAGVLSLALGCGDRAPTPPPGLNGAQLDGWQAYVDLNCAKCHGESRKGKRSGPPLTGLAERWSADELVRYLSDPDAVVKANPLLAYKAERYAISMPAISGKAPGYADKANPETLAALAEYLLVGIPTSGE